MAAQAFAVKKSLIVISANREAFWQLKMRYDSSFYTVVSTNSTFYLHLHKQQALNYGWLALQNRGY